MAKFIIWKLLTDTRNITCFTALPQSAEMCKSGPDRKNPSSSVSISIYLPLCIISYGTVQFAIVKAIKINKYLLQNQIYQFYLKLIKTDYKICVMKLSLFNDNKHYLQTLIFSSLNLYNTINENNVTVIVFLNSLI